MKKCIAKRLNEIAEKLPLVFDVEPVKIEMTGAELLLTPYAEMQPLKKDAVYEIPFFQLRAVEHGQQLKDAFKRNGMIAVHNYIDSVLSRSLCS